MTKHIITTKEFNKIENSEITFNYKRIDKTLLKPLRFFEGLVGGMRRRGAA